MMSAVGDEIVALAITFLRSSEYIKNPYLKSSLVTVLFAGQFPMYHLSKGILGDILVGSEFANEHLLHALMKFYIGMSDLAKWLSGDTRQPCHPISAVLCCT